METVLKIDHLTKAFGTRVAVNDVSLECYAGEVFGFLGPNGAGKTTTIKIITGLLDGDSGEITVNGYSVRKNYEKAMADIGAIVENPDMYKFLTGWQNLKQFQRVRNKASDEQLREIVRFVGLENRINDKVKKYSLGMKQRLGLAQAIMHKPKLLILDEPTNGLDPTGIKELRDMLKSLAHEQGVAVFVSSHLLSEMELMCDRVGIIHNGHQLGVKPVKELMAQVSGGGQIYRFTVSPADKALDAIRAAGIPNENILGAEGQVIDVKVTGAEMVSAITAALVSSGVSLMGAAPFEKRLEDIFIEMTGGGGNQIA